MHIEIGEVEAIFRYPVKSMAGERLREAELGWHGIEGDRRLAIRRSDDRSGFPWLTATQFADLLRYVPLRLESAASSDLSTHVRTPAGEELPVLGEELAREIGERHGFPVHMMQLRHGVFDDASISVINSSTVQEICRLAAVNEDARRFRPNLLVRLNSPSAFEEGAWIGGVLSFGEGADAPCVSVTMHDLRCGMINLDPDTARPSPEVLKAVVRTNGNRAGVYGTVICTGVIHEGQRIYFHKLAGGAEQPRA